MKNFLIELQERHSQQISDELEIVYYRLNRYHHKHTLALFYSESEFDYDLVNNALRMTDKVVKLEDNLFLLIFEDTDITTGGIKAAEKLLLSLTQSSPEDIYSGAEECMKNNEGSVILRRLFTLINHAIKHKRVNEIIDASYLDGIY